MLQSTRIREDDPRVANAYAESKTSALLKRGVGMLARVSRLKRMMAEERIDVAFILKPHDVFYFSGYSSVSVQGF